jgi:hypothetical protein
MSNQTNPIASDIIDPKSVLQRTLYTGAKMPGIGMGTFGSDRFTAEQVADAVKGAAEVGFRLFDCAAVYGNEHLIGEVFADIMNVKNFSLPQRFGMICMARVMFFYPVQSR